MRRERGLNFSYRAGPNSETDLACWLSSALMCCAVKFFVLKVWDWGLGKEVGSQEVN